MKKYLLILLLPFLFIQSKAQTFSWNGNMPIFDNTSDTVIIPVTGLPTIIDTSYGIAHVCFDITHTYDNDLIIKLIAPDGDSVILVQGIGGANDNFLGTCVGMDGTLFSNTNAPYSGIFVPIGNLASLNDGQNPNGNWKFIVSDMANADTGSIHHVSIEFTNNPPQQGSFGSGPTGIYTCAACVCPGGASGCDLLPDMVSSAKEIQLSVVETPGALQISNATPNIGYGPMEIYAIDSCFCGTTPVPCSQTTCPPGQNLRKALKQRIYHKVPGNDTLTYWDHLAGMMTYHPTHGHLHVDSFVSYTLRTPTSNPDATTWPIIASGTKQSFCLINIGSCSGNVGECKDGAGNTVTTVPNPGLGFHTGCGVNQGIYAGYYDVYGVGLNEPIPLNNVCNGTYYIVSITDPMNYFIESDETNNWVAVPVTLTQQNVAPTITASGPLSFCLGDSVMLTCNTAPSYLWSNGATTQSIKVYGAGTYYVSVGCGTSFATSASVTTSIITPTSSAAVSISVTSGNNPTCSGMPITFTAIPVNGGSLPNFQWKINGVNVGSNSNTFTTTFTQGNQDVSCVMTSSSNCLLNNVATSNTINVSLGLCYCIPIYGTTASSGCMDGDLIWRFKLNTLDNITAATCSSGIAGYNNYTNSTVPNMTTTLQAGSTYTCTVTAGQYGEGYRVWIDYNNDGIFSTSEAIGSTGIVAGSGQLGVMGSSNSFNVSIPCTAPTGLHRLRVRCTYNVSGTSMDPCAYVNNFGEAEDYNITISPAPSCVPPSTLSASNITSQSATLNWVANCGTSLWNVHLTLAGNGAPLNGMGSNPGVVSPFTVSGLKSSTNYEFWVQTNCGINNNSVWIGPFPFTTLVNCATLPGTSMNVPIDIGEAPCSALPYLNSQINTTANCFSNNYTGSNNQASPDVWYKFTLSSPATVQVSHCSGTTFDSYLHLLNSAGTQIASNDDNGPFCNTTQASLSSTLSAGTYYVVSEGYSTNTGSITTKINTTAACPTLNGRCFLQGYYLSGGLMSKVLYNEGVETNSNTTNVDSIEVFLHEINFPYAMKHKVKTLLKTNGTFTCLFPSSVIGSSYYIAIHHRNTVETWSANAVPFSQTTSYDFSTNLNKAYGNNQINMANNVAALYTGDMNQDGMIDVFDYLLLDPDIMSGNSGYLNTDLNGDGSVDVFDYLILYNGVTNGIGVEKP